MYYVSYQGFFCYLILGSWFLPILGFTWSLFLDFFSLHMIFLIVIISFFVFLYAFEYLESDPHIVRFLAYLCFFTFFMLILVTAGNLLQLFLGWEGVGLISFLLINFWFTRLEANRSAIKAVLFNKIGDISLIFFMVVLFFFFKTLEIPTLISLISFTSLYIFKFYFFGIIFNVNLYFLLSCLLCISAFGKSAQLGLHAWLPDAMEGPTPVSALLHSATMVTAGVFILIRFSVIIFLGGFSFFLVFFGSLTAFLAALFAAFQFDIKKIIAYSTCSQLGFMVAAVGYLNILGGFFHLFNHAFFKALLFLTAGALIHAIQDCQDIRKMGGLINYLPLTTLSMFVGFVGLSGFPFFSGFYSKEIVIFCLLSFFNNFTYLVSFCLLFSASILTLRYCFLIIYLLIFNPSFFGYKAWLKKVDEPSVLSILVFFFLICFTCFGGFFFEDVFVGVGVGASSFWFFILYFFDFSFDTFVFFEREFFFSFFRYFFFVVFIYNLALACLLKSSLKYSLIFQIFSFKTLLKTRQVHKIFLTATGGTFGFFYQIFSNFVLFFSYKWFFILLDRGFLERFGPFGFFNIFLGFSQLCFKLDTLSLFLFLNLFLIVSLFCFLSLYFYYFSFIYFAGFLFIMFCFLINFIF